MYLIVWLFLNGVFIQSVEDSKMLLFAEKVSDSRPMHYFDQKITAYFRKSKYIESDFQKTYLAFEKMGNEIFLEAGVPLYRDIKFYKLQPSHRASVNAGAVAEPFGVFLNEEIFQQLSYGQLRFIFFHEAMHIKFNHHSATFLLSYGSMVAYLGITGSFAKTRSIKFRILNGLSAGIIASFVSYKSHAIIERRADINAIKRMQCTDCVREASQLKIESDKDTDGYLTRKEFIAYNNLYNPQNTLCKFHCAANRAKIMNAKKQSNWFFNIFNKYPKL